MHSRVLVADSPGGCALLARTEYHPNSRPQMIFPPEPYARTAPRVQFPSAEHSRTAPRVLFSPELYKLFRPRVLFSPEAYSRTAPRVLFSVELYDCFGPAIHFRAEPDWRTTPPPCDRRPAQGQPKLNQPLTPRPPHVHHAALFCDTMSGSINTWDRPLACLKGRARHSVRAVAGVRTRATESHHAAPRRETTEEKARRLLNEELDKLGWAATELARRAKGDARKIRIARRLRAETAVTLKWLAAELHMGTWTHVSNLLAKPPEPVDQTELNLCQ